MSGKRFNIGAQRRKLVRSGGHGRLRWRRTIVGVDRASDPADGHHGQSELLRPTLQPGFLRDLRAIHRTVTVLCCS